MSNDTFDLKRIKQLVELMQANALTDVEIKHGDGHVILRRTPQPAPSFSQPVVLPPQQADSLPSAPVTAKPAAQEEANITYIKSPMVGTFYASSSPNSPPFVKVGDTVLPDKTVCLVEAMKVYNEIQAECGGTIAAVLVKNGETVEFGKPLFRVKM